MMPSFVRQLLVYLLFVWAILVVTTIFNNNA
jgi:hypothetical protein